MSEIKTTPPPSEVAAEQASIVDALVADKYRTAFGVIVDTRGPNPALTADLLYDTLYHPREVVTMHRTEASEKFPDRISTLTAVLPIEPVTIPDRKPFVDAMRDAMTREIDQAACLYPRAAESVELAMGKGPTAIWTAGDMWGNGADIPGSFEQAKKVVGSGIAGLRRQAHLGATAAGLASGMRKMKDTLTLVADEDKFSGRSVKKLADFFKRQGINTVTLLEDRVQNIERLQSLLSTEGIAAQGVWVRQGRHSEAEHTIDMTSITAVDTLGEAIDIVRAQPDGQGFIFDFDGVISDQKKRVKLQTEAVQASIHRHGWL